MDRHRDDFMGRFHCRRERIQRRRPTRPSFLSYPDPKPPAPIPAYLLPAKATRYANNDLLKFAHLYTDLKPIIEGAGVPTAPGLNDSLRFISGEVDEYLKSASGN